MITDMKMPEINGYEVLELLRSSSVSNSKEIPIVVATASGSCSEEELLENRFTRLPVQAIFHFRNWLLYQTNAF